MHRSVSLLFAFALCCLNRLSADEPIHRYLYAATPDGAQTESASGMGFLVFDIDAGFKFVRRINGPNLQGGVRGLTGSTESHALFYSTTDKRMGRFDLETDKVVWEKQYSGGCDRSSAMLDGSKIFAPTGWWEPTDNGGFVVIDGATGNELRRIRVGKGAHNSIMSPDGSRLFLGTQTTLTVFDPKDERVLTTIPEVGEFGVFPFTVNSKLTHAFVCLGQHVGFDVVDLALGKPIHRVLAGDSPIPHRTHGSALTPDETELWISDQVGKKLFIFDATQMPPAPKGHVDLSTGGHGWVNFSLDGAYAWSHTPDIFNARTKAKIATLVDDNGKPFASSKLIEVQMRAGKVERVGSEFGIGRKE
jgi:DNA-binding beta-propeller fold protein YncE